LEIALRRAVAGTVGAVYQRASLVVFTKKRAVIHRAYSSSATDKCVDEAFPVT